MWNPGAALLVDVVVGESLGNDEGDLEGVLVGRDEDGTSVILGKYLSSDQKSLKRTWV